MLVRVCLVYVIKEKTTGHFEPLGACSSYIFKCKRKKTKPSLTVFITKIKTVHPIERQVVTKLDNFQKRLIWQKKTILSGIQ